MTIMTKLFFIYSHVASENVVVRIRQQFFFALDHTAHRKYGGISVLNISVEFDELIAAFIDLKGHGLSDDKPDSSFYFIDLSYNFSHTAIMPKYNEKKHINYLIV